MANGREHKQTLSDAYRHADFRPFKAQFPDGRWACFLGLGPNGKMLGWWDQTTEVLEFDLDVLKWSHVLRYMR